MTRPQAADRLMLGLFSIFFVLILVPCFSNLGPVYLSDEIHYAAKAAHIAGQGNLLSSSWHAGYPITLVPIFKLLGIKKTTWLAVAVLNFVLLLSSIGFWISSLRRLGMNQEQALSMSLSSLVCFSVWGFTPWLFVNPWMQLIIAMMSRWLLTKDIFLQIFSITLTGAFAYWIHPTGLLITAAAWITIILNLNTHKDRDQLKTSGIALLGLISTILLVLLYQEIHNQINMSMGGYGGHYGNQISGYILEFKQDTFQTINEVGTALVNGIANLSIATYGYGILFFASLISMRWNNKNERDHAKIDLFVAITTIGLILFSSLLAINEPGQYQHMLHQRYTAPTIQALWILGLSQWLSHEKQSNLTQRLTITVSPVLGAIIIGIIFWNYNNNFSIIDAMSSGTSLFSNALRSEHEALTGLAIGGLLITTAQFLAWRPKFVFAGIVSCFAGWTMSQTRVKVLSGGSGRPAMIDIIKRLSLTEQICLAAIPTRHISEQSNNLYEFYLSSSRIQRLLHKRENHKQYNQFFNPDTSRCDHIVAPLDLHLITERNDLKQINEKLTQCELTNIDDYYGWGLYQCLKPNSQDEEFVHKKINIASTGAAIHSLPQKVKPLRVATKKAFNYEQKRFEYAALITKQGKTKMRFCRSMNKQIMRQQCYSNQRIIVSKANHMPLFWGFNTDSLQAGKYQLIMSEFKIYKGEVTVEIVDKNIKPISNYIFTSSSTNTPIPFHLKARENPIEVRVLASQGTQFTLPEYFIFTNSPKD